MGRRGQELGKEWIPSYFSGGQKGDDQVDYHTGEC